MKYAQKLHNIRAFFTPKKLLGVLFLGLSFTLLAIIPFLSLFTPVKTETPTYYASELKVRSTKTQFTRTERPTFKIGIGKPVTQDGKVLEEISGTNFLIKKATAQVDSLPEMEVELKGDWLTPTRLPTEVKRTATDEVEIQIGDVTSFKPGKYRMSITSGERNIEQDFTWGVLALNTDKSVYKSGETAKIGMAILDDYGRTKCLTGDTDFLIGKVWLTITSPTGEKTSFSTEQGNVQGSEGCGEHSITNEPDFYVSYKTVTPGIYQMHLEGQNQNGKRTLDDYFEVKAATPYSIQRRDSSMRIYPYSLYTNSIAITVDKDFTGQIVEKVPAAFKVSCDTCKVEDTKNVLDEYGYEIVNREAVRKVTWNVSLKKGEARTLTYTYDAPKVSPEFYLLGPITLTEQGHTSPAFEEIRSWQIASDVVRTWDGGDLVNQDWNDTDNWAGNVLCGSTDVCTFDNTSDENATINVNITPDGIDVNTGYDGTITQSSTSTIATDTTSGIAISSGTFTGGSGTIQTNVGGTLSQDGGTFTGGSGAFSGTDGNYSVTGGTHTTTTGSVSIERDFTFTGGSFTNSASGINFIDSANTDDSILTCSSDISSNGTWRIDKDIGGDFTLSSGCNADLSENVTSLVGALTNNGTLTITGSSTVLNVDTSVDNNSSLTVATNATLQVEIDLDNTGGSLTNDGTIVFIDDANTDDTTLTCSSGPSGSGTYRIDKDIGADFTLSSGCTITATESVATSLIGTLTVNGSLTLTNGTFETDANTIDNNNSLTIDGNATVIVDRNFDSSGASLTNNGTIAFEDDVDAADDSTFTCDDTVGGTVRFDKDQNNDITIVDGSGGDCIIQSVTAGTTGAVNAIGTLTSAGTLTFTDTTNTLTIDESFTNTGSFTLNASTTIQIDNNFNNSGATLSNSGTIIFEDDVDASDDSTFTCDDNIGTGIVQIDKDQSNDMVINDGINGDCIIQNLTAANTGATNSTNLFTNQGTVTFNGATTLVVKTDFTNTGSFTNNGTINLERNFADSGTVNSGSGTINFIDSSADASDDTTLTCGASSNLGAVVQNKTQGNHLVLGSNCKVDAFTRTAGVINNPASAYTLSIEGNLSMSSTTNMGGANMTFLMTGTGTQTINFAATSTTFVSKFQVDKSAGSASLTTNAFTVTGQACTVIEGTFDLNALNFTCSTGFTVETGGNLQLVSTETLTSPTLDSGSTVTYKGDGDGVVDTLTMKAYVYHHLTINSAVGSADTYQPPNDFTGANDINGNLTITDGTFDVISGTNRAVDVVGNFFIDTSGVFLAQAGTLKVGDDFTNNGTFTQGTGTVELNTATTTTLNGSGSPAVTFNNFTVTTAGKTVQFTAAKTFRINGVLTITGTSGNEIVINSTSGSQWFINHQGTESVTYANVSNSGCDGTSTQVDLSGGTNINGGNNGSCWFFVLTDITVSGNIYTDEGSTAYDCSGNTITVWVSVNGAAGDSADCTLNTGAFSITADLPSSADDPVVIYIDSGESIKATTVTLAANTSSNITSQKLYTDHVILSHQSSGPMTNAKMATGDNGDSGIRYSVASNNLTTDPDMELFVFNSKTYTPGGTVTTNASGGDFQLDNSATATLANATNTIGKDLVINTGASLTINADTIVNGGDITATGTLTTSSGTPTITTRGTGSISGAGTKTVHHLTIGDGTSATTTLSGSLTANGDVSVGTNSTFNVNATLAISGGDFTTTTTGDVNTTSGTPTVTVSGTGNVGAGTGGTFTLYNLAVSGTQTLASDITLNNDLSVTTGASLALASKNLTLSGGDAATSGTGTITCSGCSSGTLTTSGTGTIGGGGSVTVYNLQVNGTQTLGSTLTVSNDAVVGTGGILDLGSQNMTVSGGDFTNTTTGIIRCNSCSSGTLTLPATGSLGGGDGNITLYNLTTSGTGTTTFSGSGTNTVSNNVTVGSGTTLAINSSVSITGSLTNTTTGIITTTSGTPTVTVSGSSIGGGSGALTFYNLTKSGAGTTTFSGSGTNTVNNDLSVSNGTFTQSNTLTVTNDISVSTGATFNTNATLNVNGGDFTTSGTGVINTTSGTPTLTISGTGTVGGGNGNITLHNLTTSGTGTTTFSGGGTNTINSNVSVGSGTTLNINSSVSITGNLTNTTTGIIGTTSGTPTVTVSGTTIGGGSGAITIYNLTKATSSTATFSGSGTNTISNNLAVADGTLTVSNNISIGNDVSVATGDTLNLNGDTSVAGGDVTTTGTGVVSTTSGTPTLTISGTGTVGGGGNITTYNLVIGGTQTIASTTSVSNDLTVNGTMSGSSNITVNGHFTGSGSTNMSAGTVEHRVGSDKNFGSTSGSGSWTFSTLKFTNSSGSTRTITTQTGGSGGITVSTILQVGETDDTAGIALNAGNKTWTLSGTNGAPLSVEDGSVSTATSTFAFTGNNAGGNTTINDIAYYSLTVNNASETYVLAGSSLAVSNTLTVTAGTLSLGSNSVTVGATSVTNSGSILVSGTYTQTAGGTTTVKTSSGGSATLGGSGTTTFYNLSITPDASSATVTLGTATSQTITVSNNLTVGNGTNSVTVSANTNNPILDINGSLTINTNGTLVAPPSSSFTLAGSLTSNGTFNANSGTLTLDTTTTATIDGNGSPAITFHNLTSTTANKTILFTSGETVRTNGLLTLTGSSGNLITVDATSNGSQWNINHQGTENITYTSVQDSGCDGSSTAITLGTTNVNNGNNGSCWTFTMDVSGNIYTDEGSTAYNCSSDNLTVHISINGAASTTTTCTLNTGAFSFSGVTQPSSGTPIVIFIDSAETPKATTVTLASSSLSGVKLYQNHVNLSHENAGPITSNNLGTADNGDSGIRYAVSSGNLTVDSDMELHVLSSKTFTPSGTVTTQGTSGDFHLASSASSTLGNTTTISGDIQVDTGATLTVNGDTTVSGGAVASSGTGSITTSSGTPTLTISGTGNIGGGGSVTTYNLTVNGTQTLQSNLTANNDIAVGNGGTLALNGKDVTVTGGDMTTTGTGTVTCSACSAGTVTVNGTAATGIGGGGSVTTYNLTIGGTVPIASTLTALNALTVNGTMSGSSNVTVNGDIAGTGSINMSGGTTEQRVGAAQNFGTTSGSSTWTFSTLIFSNSSGSSRTITTQTGGSGSITASTLLQIGKGGDSAATVLDAGNRTWIMAGTSGTPFTLPQGTFTANTSTVSYTGNNGGGNTTLANVTYYSLNVNNSAETYNPASSVSVDNALSVSNGVLDLQTNNATVGSTSVSNSGGITVAGTLTQSSSATTTVRTSASGTASIGGTGSLTFYNLTLAPAANSGTLTLGTASNQSLTVTNDLTIGNGTNSVTVTANSNNPSINVDGDLTINSSGTLVAPPSSTLSIAANFTNNGTFTANGGTVQIDGSGTSVLDGSGTPAIIFANFTSNTAGKTLQFTASKTFRVTGAFTIAGANGNNIAIQSTTGTQWVMDHEGTENVTFATVTNSGCDGTSTEISLGFSVTDGGNNGACWAFTAGSVVQSRFKGNSRIGGSTRIQ